MNTKFLYSRSRYSYVVFSESYRVAIRRTGLSYVILKLLKLFIFRNV